jgi:hypothetical protein
MNAKGNVCPCCIRQRQTAAQLVSSPAQTGLSLLFAHTFEDQWAGDWACLSSQLRVAWFYIE